MLELLHKVTGKEESARPNNSTNNERDLMATTWEIGLGSLNIDLFQANHIVHHMIFTIECQLLCKTEAEVLDGHRSCHAR